MNNFFNPIIPGLDAANPGITGLENSVGIPVLGTAIPTVGITCVNRT